MAHAFGLSCAAGKAVATSLLGPVVVSATPFLIAHGVPAKMQAQECAHWGVDRRGQRMEAGEGKECRQGKGRAANVRARQGA